MQRIKTVRHSKCIEHAAETPQLKYRFASIQIDFHAILGDRGGPHYKCLRNPRVIGMQAQRARGRKAVDSYESESAFVSLLIGTNELALYKASVCMEAIGGLRARPGVDARSVEHEIDLPYKTAEIGYCRRIPSFWMGSQRVGQRKGRAVDRAWEISMDRYTKGVKLGVGNRERLPT
jgi:hypothetical protein